MSFERIRAVPALAIAGVAVSMLAAPVAAAGGADVTIDDLESQGYSVQINYLNGASESLEYCTVVNVNNPDSTPHPPSDTTLYDDVHCSNHHY